MRFLKIRESAWFNAPPGEVWRRILALDEWPRWHPGIVEARWRGRRGWREGNRFQLAYRSDCRPFMSRGMISRVEPDRQLRWTSRFLFQAFNVEYGLEVRPDGRGTRVCFETQFEGLAARLVAGSKHLDGLTGFQRAFLSALRESVEKVGSQPA